MAKQNDLPIWIVVGLLAFSMFSGGSEAPDNGGGDPAGVNLCEVVEPQASFTGQRMFLQGTALTGDHVRIIKKNGVGVKDLGLISMNSGTQNTAPQGEYNLYWGENATARYTEVERYTAPCQDATDDKTGVLCTIDTNPTVSIFDEFGNVQSASANAQALGADDERDVVVRVRVASDQCFGNPDIDVSGTNALCFRYNTTVFKSVVANTGAISTPFSVSSAQASSGFDISCYALDKLADNTFVDVPVKLKTESTQPDAIRHNISIYLDDIAFDLNADSLDEIMGFVDEDNNALGSALVTGDKIYVS